MPNLATSSPTCGRATNHRGVQLNDARQAVERWIHNYGQHCWLRQLTPYATREQEDRVLRVIARMDGTPFPIDRSAHRPLVSWPDSHGQ